MSLAERKDRWNALWEGVRDDNVMTWRDNFVRRLEETRAASGAALFVASSRAKNGSQRA